MRSKTNIDLIHQTLTRLWYYNIFMQKPLEKGTFFLQVFKIVHILEIFFVFYRFIYFRTRKTRLINLTKKLLYRVTDVNIFLLLNLRFILKNNTFYFFCNFSSRSKILSSVFLNRQLKRITIYSQKYKYFKKLVLLAQYEQNYFFFNRFFSIFWNVDNQSYIYKFNLYKLYFIYIIFLLQFKSYLSLLYLIKLNTRLWESWFFNMYFLRRIIFYRKKFKKKWGIKYIIVKLKKHKFLKKWICLRNLFIFRYSIFLNKKNITKKLQNITNYCFKFMYKFFLFYRFCCFFLKNFFIKFFLKKINFFKIKSFSFGRFAFKYFIHNLSNFKRIFRNLFIGFSNFFYIRSFNFFFEHRFSYFVNNLNFKIVNFIFTFQQEFSIPKSNYYLVIFSKKLRMHTNFLRIHKKFYNNFINIMPVLQNFNTTQLFSKQFANELSRTKKHWRVLRGIELIFIQAMLQLKNEPFNNKTMFTGFNITIKGRPGKSSRTQKIKLNFGQIKLSDFVKNNLFEVSSVSNAQIGSFGITIKAMT